MTPKCPHKWEAIAPREIRGAKPGQYEICRRCGALRETKANDQHSAQRLEEK